MRWFAIMLGATGCKSATSLEITFHVPTEIAELYQRGEPGLLQSSLGGNIAPVCGVAIDPVYSLDESGCRPDEPEVTIDAWIVPVPNGWDTALCYDKPKPGSELDETKYPPELLPGPTELDPAGTVDAKWSWTPMCGGKLEAEIDIER
ncbi:MAG: hypothetical protein ABMB14_06765 [Myxococcota bacterium]